MKAPRLCDIDNAADDNKEAAADTSVLLMQLIDFGRVCNRRDSL